MWTKAANQGHAGAQYNLGVMYEQGQGVAQNNVEAVRWYRKAADQGHAQAQFNLGCMYAEGQGVAQSDVEAVRWYRKAADQGYAQAQLAICMPLPGGNACCPGATNLNMAYFLSTVDVSSKENWVL